MWQLFSLKLYFNQLLKQLNSLCKGAERLMVVVKLRKTYWAILGILGWHALVFSVLNLCFLICYFPLMCARNFEVINIARKRAWFLNLNTKERSEWVSQMKVSHKYKCYIWFIQQDKNVKYCKINVHGCQNIVNRAILSSEDKCIGWVWDFLGNIPTLHE